MQFCWHLYMFFCIQFLQLTLISLKVFTNDWKKGYLFWRANEVLMSHIYRYMCISPSHSRIKWDDFSLENVQKSKFLMGSK